MTPVEFSASCSDFAVMMVGEEKQVDALVGKKL